MFKILVVFIFLGFMGCTDLDIAKVVCLTDENCPADSVCENKECKNITELDECDANYPCKGEYSFCDEVNNICRDNYCTTLKDCVDNATCVTNRCTCKNDFILKGNKCVENLCTPGDKECGEDGGIYLCNNDNELILLDSCAYNEECGEDNKICKVLTCDKRYDESLCYDKNNAGICINDKWRVEPCGFNKICEVDDENIGHCVAEDVCFMDKCNGHGDCNYNNLRFDSCDCYEGFVDDDDDKTNGDCAVCDIGYHEEPDLNEGFTCVRDGFCNLNMDCGPHGMCNEQQCECEPGYHEGTNAPCEPNTACVVDEKRCSSNGKAISTCGVNNLWNELPCSNDDICLWEGGEPKCADPCTNIYCTENGLEPNIGNNPANGVCRMSDTGGMNGDENNIAECFCNSSYSNDGNRCLYFDDNSNNPCKDIEVNTGDYPTKEPVCGDVSFATCRVVDGAGNYMCICMQGYERETSAPNSKCILK